MEAACKWNFGQGLSKSLVRTDFGRSWVERCLAEVAHLLDGCKEGDRVEEDLMREVRTEIQH